MRKLFTLTLALLASFSLWAYTAPAEGSYDLTSESTAKVNSSGRFVVISEGLYAYRLGSGYSYSNGNGLKTQSNQGGFVFCLNAETNVTFTIKHTESKNAHTATMKIYSISEAQYKEFDDNKAAATKSQTIDVSEITPTEFDIAITAETKDFTGTTTLSAGYYSVVPTGPKSNTYLKALGFEAAAVIVDPVSEVTIAGPTQGIKDYASSFSATTDVKADSYKWFVNDVEQTGATAKTFNFTPATAGDYSIVCKARNANNETDDWIASDPIAFKAFNTLFGELIKAVHTGKTTATVTGLIGGTADKSTEAGGKINSNGYFGIQLASGNFQAGDTLNVNITTANTSAAVLIIYAEKTAENVILNTEDAGVVGDNKYVLPAAINNKNKLYIVRTEANQWNAVVNSISVIRPMATKSTVEVLNNVKIDGVAISDGNLETLKSSHSLASGNSYVNAPEVKFYKQVTITYEDDSQKVMNDSIVVTATENAGGKWEAQATINEVEYTITMGKQASFTVTYMDGATKLGEENVAVNGHPSEYAQYQNKSLYSFGGWYDNPELTGDAIDLSAATITEDITYYANFEKVYATSINIEQKVLDNGTGYNLMGYMGTINYASNIENSLDTLNDLEKKDNRNYAYLGLKVKSAGKLLNFRLANGSVLKVKFGAYKTGSEPQVSINGSDYAAMTITDGVYSHTADGDELVSIKTATADAVIFKQIMINEEIEDVVLPAPGAYAITLAETTNGSITASWEGKTDKKVNVPVSATVTLTLTPDDGYKVASVTVNGGDPLAVSENTATFTMPAAAANVVATFSVATAIDNTADEIKAVKFIENGQLFIRRGEKVYTITGEEVK